MYIPELTSETLNYTKSRAKICCESSSRLNPRSGALFSIAFERLKRIESKDAKAFAVSATTSALMESP